MFNSPSTIRATPRKSTRPPRTPSVISERDAIPPSTTRSSRLAIFKPTSPISSAGDTFRTARAEIDGYEKIYWSKDESCGVSSLGNLPKEVVGVLKTSDLIHTPVEGHVDTISGFAMITTSSTCKAWNYAKRTHSSPTTYTFPAPPLSKGHGQIIPPALASFCTGSSSSEPGLLLLSPTGELRFWETLSMALSNVDRYQEVYLDLGEDDFVERIWSLNNSSFIVTTTSSLAFRINITSANGRLIPSISTLTKPGGMFARASSIIFSDRDDKAGIRAMTIRDDEFFLLAGKTLQRWSITSDTQKDCDLREAIGTSLFDNWTSGDVSLELCDIAKNGNDQLAVLISYNEDGPRTSSSQASPPSYVIVMLDLGGRTGLSVSRFIDIAYKPTYDSRSLDIQRLYIPLGSPTAFVRFSSSIVTVSLSTTVFHEDVISLTEPNAIIGIGQRHFNKRSTQIPGLTVVPAHGGLLSVEAYELSTQVEAGSAEPSATSRLKSKIEQAVYFGDRGDNPLSFQVPTGDLGNVSEAVEAVSSDIIASRSSYMPALSELRPQLSDRALRLRGLITFVRNQGLLSMLSQTSRRRLLSDAEKVSSGIKLWDYQNRLMSQLNSRGPQSLLADSISAYMSTIYAMDRDDIVRAFFRTQLAYLDKLLETVFATFRAVISGLTDNRADWVFEANEIFLHVLRTASQLRQDAAPKYEVDANLPPIELWTSQDSLLQAAEFLYFATQEAIAERSRQFGTVIDETASDRTSAEMKSQQVRQSQLKDHMALLAAALCINMEDRVRLASAQMELSGASEQEALALDKRWKQLRTRVIRPLVEIDRVENAYGLAEHHSDWESLVYLCHHPNFGKTGTEIQMYIERHGKHFAYVLYQWYIDNGRQHALLSQDEVYGGLVTDFFKERGYPELSWIHHIACRRYGEAASDLLLVDAQVGELDQKHVLSSIGKLSAVANIKSQGDSAARKQLLVDLDDELDMINIQNTLREQLIGAVPVRRNARPSMETFATQYATCLSSRPAFRSIFVEASQQLVDGLALDVEDLIDVLTLKDNKGDRAKDPIIALERLVRDTTLPDGRKQVALLSIWRRVYIRDDWAEISNTSGRSEQAQRDLQRRTLAYRVLKSLDEIKDMPKSFHLTPLVATQPPLLAELSARFPDRTPEEIQSLMDNHLDEIRVLETYIKENRLEERVLEVASLVKRDIEGIEVGAEDEDVVM